MKHQPATADPISDNKKRRRVGFSAASTGINANDCIEIYLVSRKEEVGASDSSRINTVDLNDFFDEDGKIYGYDGLKITIWISIISFHSYADITYKSTYEGKKGITDLKSALQNIFGVTLVEDKDEFLQTFSAENHFTKSILSSGEILQHHVSNVHIDKSIKSSADSELKVVRMKIGETAAGELYSRLVPLALLLVDGSNPIDVADSGWEIYVLVQNNITDEQGSSQYRLLGFAALYRFYHYPDSTRLRLGQILVLPLYQRKGYGSFLLEAIYNVAMSEDVYEFTVEEPVDELQLVRTTVDVRRLLNIEPIQDAVNSVVLYLKQGKLSKKTGVPEVSQLPSVFEDARKILKINRKQFCQCWEVLIFLGLGHADKYMEDFVMLVANRLKAEIIGRDSGRGKKIVDVPSEYNPDMSFVMFRSQDEDSSAVQTDENQTNQEEQLQQLVDERVKVIQLIAKKALQH